LHAAASLTRVLASDHAVISRIISTGSIHTGGGDDGTSADGLELAVRRRLCGDSSSDSTLETRESQRGAPGGAGRGRRSLPSARAACSSAVCKCGEELDHDPAFASEMQ
jgi:hypothetical protein